jgi:hypothetical protein
LTVLALEFNQASIVFDSRINTQFGVSVNLLAIFSAVIWELGIHAAATNYYLSRDSSHLAFLPSSSLIYLQRSITSSHCSQPLSSISSKHLQLSSQ